MEVGEWTRKHGVELADMHMAMATEHYGDDEVVIPDIWADRMEMIAAGVLGVEQSDMITKACAIMADNVQIARHLESLDEAEGRVAEAVSQLVSYLHHDEFEDFNESKSSGEDVSGHIFIAVSRADEWFEENHWPEPHWHDTTPGFLARLRKDPDDAEAKRQLLQCGRVADGKE